jgi:ABC-type uncharacterized transport system fused permease/ATPase subunit
LWTVAGEIHISIFGVSLPIPGYMVWCALLYAASGSWLAWRVGHPLVGLNSQRYQREAEFRFALVRATQQADAAARFRDADVEKRRLGLALGKVRVAAASDCLRYNQAHLDHCRLRMDFNCRSDRHRVARIFQRQMFLRRTDGRSRRILSG